MVGFREMLLAIKIMPQLPSLGEVKGVKAVQSLWLTVGFIDAG